MQVPPGFLQPVQEQVDSCLYFVNLLEAWQTAHSHSQADYTALFWLPYEASPYRADLFSSTTEYLFLLSSLTPLLLLKQGKCKTVFTLWLSKHWNIWHLYSVSSAGSGKLSSPQEEPFAGKLLLLCMSLLQTLKSSSPKTLNSKGSSNDWP